MGKIKAHIFEPEVNELSQMARVLSNPARIAILLHISNSYQCICNDLVKEIGLAQPTITQHLNELKKIGLIEGHYQGTQLCLCIVPKQWKVFQKAFKDLFDAIEPNNC